MPFCIGLTGGIGSGKSSAAEIFRKLGAGIVDTDAIAHELTRPGGASLSTISGQFGAEYIAADGGLDRSRMRRLVFSDLASKKRLEAILHPLIRAESEVQIAAAHEPYVMIAVPLLLETGAYRELIDRVLVVDCAEEQQVTRTMQRSAITADEVRAIMAAQLPRSERLTRADDVLHNDTDMTALQRQAEALHSKYLDLARCR